MTQSSFLRVTKDRVVNAVSESFQVHRAWPTDPGHVNRHRDHAAHRVVRARLEGRLH